MRRATGLEQHMASTSLETAESISDVSDISSMAGIEKSGYDQLPKEMHEMRIRDEKSNTHDEKVHLKKVNLLLPSS